MRQREFEKIIANYQDIMQSQVERIEQLKKHNEELKGQLEALQQSQTISHPSELALEGIARFRGEALLLLRTLDELYPHAHNGIQTPEDDYYLELARLSKPSAATMPDDQLAELIKAIGGVE